MSAQRFTPEFNQEAVRQIIEWGYSVAEVSARLGVSAHSLYKRAKAVKPDKSEAQASEYWKPSRRCFACGHKVVDTLGPSTRPSLPA
ncbi:transposase [Burkholderia gladioli]|nr:transposase [Burkholderia gladioli]